MARVPAKMPRADEMRILAATEEATADVEAGCSPNEAIAKAAAAHGLPRGHVGLLVTSYNVGRTLAQMQAGATPAEKAASFPLADADAILERLYPGDVRAAAKAASAAGVSADYDAPPTWYEPAAPALAKAANPIPAPAAAPPAPAPPPVAPHPAGRHRVAQAARTDAAAAQDLALGKVAHLAYTLETGPYSLDEVRGPVEAAWGAPAATMLDYIAGTRPALAKRAGRRPGRIVPFSKAASPFRELRDALDALEDVHRCRRKLASALAALDPPTPAPAAPISVLGPPVSAKEAGAAGDLGLNLLRGAMFQLGARATDQGPSDDRVGKAVRELGSPGHEQQIREIRARAVLTDLLRNDEVLAGHDPHEVVSAFNRISELGPRVAEQPALMQALLRKHLQQGALDTFEGNELVGTEEKLRKIQGPARPPATPSALPKPDSKPKGALDNAFSRS